MLRLFRKYYPIRNVIFASGEGLVIYLSVIIAAYIKLGSDLHVFDDWVFFKSMLITVVCQIALYYNDLYDLKVTNNYVELGIRLLQALGIATIFFGIAYYLIPQLMIGEGIFVIMIGLLILLIVSWRIGYTLVLEKGLFNQKLIIIGSGELATGIIKEIRDKRDSGYEIDTILDEEDCREGVCGIQLDMCDQAKAKNISKIIVALEEKRGNLPIRQLLKCRTEGIEILEGTSFYEMLLGKLYVKQINPSWLIFSDGFRKSPLKSAMKRTGDIILSSIMLVMLSPMILITAILIKIDSKGPVIFSQERVGQNGKGFNVHKFRSMVTDAEKSSGPVWASEDDDRVTRVGRVIRKLRIDELPQLWNVLKGEMSFVGPRPERAFFIQQLEKDVPYYSERLTVKPGLTGWAQVSYPYGASVEDAIEKLNYDLFYTKNMSFLLDLLIIFRTVKIVLFGKGAR
ncbi:MAG: TIGR03013 family PEP-CTERM/XrtA system glycosyltransferase [Desulfobacteraceae bacterium]|nr:TIGR03013 family PEP-CTERM/XrtA system glycosyltransferase [Desulfobacteraceae bacterium]MBC2749236.1 TIGR03013 family PEP-CTERM/XrtA system glycosyltransferase [Desulfobacteraceae bacterium]